ncbi:MAG: tRNA lysidine(34) synthetase TilS, partial [Actinomycetia bacterium]|nr:tRNA lysidine(34) synthetase TilS [Actinomycetes bacterium]
MILKKGFQLDKFEQKALKTIKKYRMLKKNDKVLVAVSGGPDSVALLNILLTLKTKYNLSLHVFHLDHMIRKEKSRKDAIFVKKLTDRLKLPRTILSFNVPVFSKELGYSLEEAGRKVRYKLYEKVSAQIKADKIALGHQADDQIETFLMRMIRGTGLEGLSGIPPRRGEKIIRPLIETSRDEIESYCFQKNIKFRTDETNLEGSNLRSKIRYYLLPYLLAYNRQFRKNILNLINIVRE